MTTAPMAPTRRRKPQLTYYSTATTAAIVCCCIGMSPTDSFTIHPIPWTPSKRSTSNSRLYVYAPPGSGYARPEDETSYMPDTYEPMMEYPGTMRPGRTPENMPFQDLPIGDDDPDPVPWPHFQEIEWHHRWEPPHEHPIPMEDFIDMHGRWATPELEAAMRAGVRRTVRDRQAQQQSERDVITDDDDEEDDYTAALDDPIALGDGVFGKLGSDADRARTAVLTAGDNNRRQEATRVSQEEELDVPEGELDDFLLNLGLDSAVDDEYDNDSKGGSTQMKNKDMIDDDDVSQQNRDVLDANRDSPATSIRQGGTATIRTDGNAADDDDDDDDSPESVMEIGLDEDVDGGDDDDEDSVATVPLEDDFDNELLDGEDVFDEGGFDFDDGDGYGNDGDGMW